MEITAIQKYIHMTPRKVRLVADMVRSMKPSSALLTLKFTNKAAALPVSKAIKTALANAKQQGLSEDQLVFKKLEIDEGFDMKRVRAAGRGFRRPYEKKTSRIKIVLTDEIKKGGSV